jgi:hypothetical protein
LPVVAGLALLRSIDAEQPHELRAELHDIAVYDLKPWLGGGPSHSIVIGLRSCRGSNYESQ